MRVPQRKNMLCILIEASVAEFNPVNVATALRALMQARCDGVPHGVVERALQALEAAALGRLTHSELRKFPTPCIS